MKVLENKWKILLVLSLLLSLTACKTVEIRTYVPQIILPEIESEPDHAKWVFVFNSEENLFELSEEHLRVLLKYIGDLKLYGNTGWTWVQYSKDETDRLTKKYFTDQ